MWFNYTFLMSHLITIFTWGQNKNILILCYNYKKQWSSTWELRLFCSFKKYSMSLKANEQLYVSSLGTWPLRAQHLRSPIGIWMKWQTLLSNCRTRLGSGCSGSPATSLPTKGHYFYSIELLKQKEELNFVWCLLKNFICEVELQFYNMTSKKTPNTKSVFLSCDRYMNGAATNPDCHVLAYAGAQVKKGLDIAKKLGAENFGTIYIVRTLNMDLSF